MLKTKWTISRITRTKILYTKLKVIKLNRRRREAKRKAAKGLKNAIYPSLPGVSRLKLPEPPVPHLTYSNRLPTEDETQRVRAAIDEVKEEKESLRRKLFLRSVAGESSRIWEAAMRHKIGRATKFIRQHQGVISPIRRLPPELLEEIFQFTTSFRVQSRWSTGRELPWTLAQVCRSWRVSALAISSLWSHIPTIMLKKSHSRTNRQLSSLKETLKRSREAPLTFYVYARSHDMYSHPVLDLLAQHRQRWKNVTLEISRNLFGSLKHIKGELPALETLSLQVRFGLLDTTIDMFEVAPRLRDVNVSGTYSGDMPIALPYAQLISYKERMMSRDLITRVVASPSSPLESLTILELADGPALPPITLPNLLKLTVKFYYGLEAPFLNNLTLPAIEEVRIVSYRGNVVNTSLLETLITMLSNSSPCRLKDLAYRADCEEVGVFSRLLRLTPKLVNLDATIPSAADLLSLAHGFEDRLLVPRLETCKFHCDAHSPDTETTQALNALATARCEVVSEIGESSVVIPGEILPLKSLSMYFDSSDFTHDVHARLHGWKPTVGSIALKFFRMQLLQELPELDFGRPPRSRKIDLKWSDRVSKVLDAIDEFKVEDVNDIFVRTLSSPDMLFSDSRS